MRTGRRHPRPGIVISPRRRRTDWRTAQKSPTVRPSQRLPHGRANFGIGTLVMGLSDLSANDATARTTSGRHLLLLLATFTAAIFVSAALLFLVQPMFTKMVLPRFGGAPSVWSVAMVFFQAALLAGYAYAHLLTRYAPGRKSLFIQLAVMVAACFMLPLSIASGWGKPPAVGEAFWLLGLFAVSIGLPFFALAANSPLLQAWFARSDHPA